MFCLLFASVFVCVALRAEVVPVDYQICSEKTSCLWRQKYDALVKKEQERQVDFKKRVLVSSAAIGLGTGIGVISSKLFDSINFFVKFFFVAPSIACLEKYILSVFTEAVYQKERPDINTSLTGLSTACSTLTHFYLVNKNSI